MKYNILSGLTTLLVFLGVVRLPEVISVAPSRVDSLRPIINMVSPRASHTATLLRDGRVLIAGGFERERVFIVSSEIYNPSINAFSSAANMNTPRVGHTATLLHDGKVLITGGFGNGYLSSAEVYDPGANTYRFTGSMAARRDGFTATLLHNGKVLIAGGYDGSWQAGAELYDPESGRFTHTGRMNTPRTAHTATLLPDGRTLITGGNSARSNVLASAEVYNPATGVFTPAGNLTRVRHKHAAILLSDGNVLIIGGSDNRDWNGRYADAEIYRATDGSFTGLGNMSATRFKFPDAIVRLINGKVIVAGAGEQVEIYDAKSNTFATAEGRMDTARYYSTATMLADGRVLITGGYNQAIVGSSRAWIYDDQSARISVVVTSAASFERHSVAPEAIVTAFGSNLASDTLSAASIPLPTELAGASVRFNGVLAGLLFVSPQQINLLVPSTTNPGPATVEITSSGGAINRATADVNETAPGIFTSNRQGTEAPAALTSADGINYRSVGNPDGTSNPLNPGEYLILFGTGLRRALPGMVEITIGGVPAPILFAGSQPDYLGLDQVNTVIPIGINGIVEIVLKVNGRAANRVKIKIN